MLAISIIATVLSLSGNLLVNLKRKSGFVVWILSNIVWVYIAMHVPNYPQAIMFMCYALLNVHGYLSWSRGDDFP